MSSTTQGTPKNAINVIAVVHDDVPGSARKTIYADHFHPLVSELKSFTGRQVHVVFAGGKPYSNFDYKGDEVLKTLQDWEPLGHRLLSEMKKEGLETNNLTKVILLTNDMLSDRTAGAALLWPPTGTGTVAISSLGSYLFVGHEIGHLLGARHEDYEVQYNGWWSETYMAPKRDLFRTIAYTFSPANRKNIMNYLADKD